MSNHRVILRSLQAASIAGLLAFAAGCSRQAAPKPPTDQQIASQVQAKIAVESALGGQNIQVGVESGVVTLSGMTTDQASRSLAGNDAGSVTGVKTVVNNLTVQPAPAAQPAAAPGPASPKQEETARERRERLKKERRKAQQEQAQQQAPPTPPAAQPVPEQVQTVAPAPPPPPPAPVVKKVTVPSGTVVAVRMIDALDSGTAQPNQTFHASLASDLMVDGMVALPQGTNVTGRVIDAKDAAHFKGNSLLTLELTEIKSQGKEVPVVTDSYSKQGNGRGKNTAEKVGGGAALGAIIGALAGGGKGAAIGAAAGGGLGAGANGVTRGQQVQIKAETLVNFKLQSPITVTTSRAAGSPRSYSDNSPQLEPRPQ